MGEFTSRGNACPDSRDFRLSVRDEGRAGIRFVRSKFKGEFKDDGKSSIPNNFDPKLFHIVSISRFLLVSNERLFK